MVGAGMQQLGLDQQVPCPQKCMVSAGYIAQFQKKWTPKLFMEYHLYIMQTLQPTNPRSTSGRSPERPLGNIKNAIVQGATLGGKCCHGE